MGRRGHTQVRAYTFGPRMFAEVDVVLPADMPLREAHDIGESLQVSEEFSSVHLPGGVIVVVISAAGGEAQGAFYPLPNAGVMPFPCGNHPSRWRCESAVSVLCFWCRVLRALYRTLGVVLSLLLRVWSQSPLDSQATSESVVLASLGGERLFLLVQDKIESMEEIERAFVHLDYECDHRPEHNSEYYPPTPKERGRERGVGAVLQAADAGAGED